MTKGGRAPKSALVLDSLASVLAKVDDKLAGVTKLVPKTEAHILRAAMHELRSAQFMVVGVKWMLENQDNK